jgi:hypothetical protein
MSSNDLYTVAHKGKKLVDEFRGDRVYGDSYLVVKVNKILRTETGFYNVTTSTIGDWCDCPAGSRHPGPCRHQQMVSLFKTKKALNKGKLYDFDKQEWIK